MAGFITHYFFGIDIYYLISNSDVKQIIKENTIPFVLGLQGPDIFFYHIFRLIHRDHRNLGSYIHEHRTGKFFASGFHQISYFQSKEEKKIALAYLCGFLCHYTLDSACHPYIYARSDYEITNPNSKSLEKHTGLEDVIDRKILAHYKQINLADFNQKSSFCLSKKERQVIAVFLSRVIYRTFGDLFSESRFFITPFFIKKVLIEARVAISLLTDPAGKRKRFIVALENRTIRSHVLSNKFITNVPIQIKDPMNYNHTPWANPWNKSIITDNSFLDEYQRALLNCEAIFDLINSERIINKKMTKKDWNCLWKKIGNYSYHSGLEAEP